MTVKIRHLLLAACLAFEVANMIGFSWTRLRRVSNDELVEAAIRYRYGGVYSGAAALRAEYAAFDPEVYYWGDLTGEAGNQFLNKLFGFKLFQVKLPDAVVIVSVDGVAKWSRNCGDNSWCAATVAPDRPVLGIVGTVQDGPPDYAVATGFALHWSNGSDGDTFTSGHCFSALSHSPSAVLSVSGPREGDVVTIGGRHGYYLVVIMDIKRAAYGLLQITEQEFRRSQTCDKTVRAAWPNAGGVSWKR